MNQETIALVFMADEQDSFFIENPPKLPIPKWIGRFADLDQVEYVQIFVRGPAVSCWSNPNCCAEY